MKTWYPTKAAWAEARAAECRKTYSELRFGSSGGSYIKAARKGQSMRFLLDEAARFDRKADRFRERGE